MQNYLIVLSVSLAVSLLLVVTKRWHGHFSFDLAEGIQKFHTSPTPRIGGIAIFSGLAVGWWIAKDVERLLLTPLLIACIPAFAFGLLEDITKRVGVTARLLATMSSGVVACLLTGIAVNRADVPLMDDLLQIWPFAVLFTAFAAAGIANAVNIIDGFNGLSSGTVMIILTSLGFIATNQGDTLLAESCLLLGAAIFGFWLVNFPFGKLFLGDGGAYFVGFSLAWLGILLFVRNPGISPWVVVLACAYPVIEVLYSIWRRFSYKQPTSAPDNLHLHSIVKTQFIVPRMKQWPAHFKNAAVSPLIWVYSAMPASLAVWLSNQALWKVLSAIVLCVAAYHLIYKYLANQIGANSEP